MRRPQHDQPGVTLMIWVLLAAVVLGLFVAVLWALRPPTPGVADTPNVVPAPDGLAKPV